MVLPMLRPRHPLLKKQLATARFRIQRSPLVSGLLISVLTVITLFLLLPILPFPQAFATWSPVDEETARVREGQSFSSEQDSSEKQSFRYMDPCLDTLPDELVHFDPSSRISKEFSNLLSSAANHPSQDRIFSTFFGVYLFEPYSDVVVSLNATSRGRPTDIRNGMHIAEMALRRFHDDPSIRIINYTLGYEDLDRVRGSRYIFHLFARNATHSDLRHVVAIQRTFDNVCHISVRSYPTKTFQDPVYVILPYSERPHRFSWFLTQFEDIVIDSPNRAQLLIAVCKQNKTDVEFVRQFVLNSAAKEHITTIEVPGDKTSFFSRAIAIREAAKHVPSDSVMFISDVDMYLFPPLLDSCRYNSIKGSQVYFPVFYSLFPRNDRIAKSGGYWRRSSLGMSCMYRADFDNVAAYKNAENDFIGWGKEDLALSSAFRKAPEYELFRAVEPALRHKWHRKYCEPLTSAYEDCLTVMFQQLGDVNSVGRFMLSHNLDAQKLFEKFADDDDDTARQDIQGSSDSKVTKRFRERMKLLNQTRELAKKRILEREKVREMEWRKRTGISKQQDEKAFQEEAPPGLQSEPRPGKEERKEIAKDRELVGNMGQKEATGEGADNQSENVFEAKKNM